MEDESKQASVLNERDMLKLMQEFDGENSHFFNKLVTTTKSADMSELVLILEFKSDYVDLVTLIKYYDTSSQIGLQFVKVIIF